MIGRTLGFVVAALLVAAFMAPASQAQWVLDGPASRISFVSIKAGDVAEAHYFKTLSGSIDEDGKALVEVDLASVETLIDLRNERMINFLFEVEEFPVAEIHSVVNLADFSEMAVGSQQTVLIDLVVKLHNASSAADAEIVVTRLQADRVLLTSLSPVILDAADYLFEGGIQKLQELASLDVISFAVPVTFQLVFVQK